MMTEKHFCLDDSPEFRMLELDEVTSTNEFLRGYKSVDGERRITLVTAEYQTAGRGAGTNHWESQRGENLLFSLLVHPRHIPADHMFVMSEIMSLAVREAIAPLNPPMMGGDGRGLFSIKWPNDIYYGDKKICGMLIENDLRGTCVERCVMGVGINVNQTAFESDAPNPISLAQILGQVVERRFVLESIMEHFTRYYKWTEQGRLYELHEMYLSHLYRIHEKHRFREEKGEFCATITAVEPTGHLVLVDQHGAERRYAFKEVEYLI